AVVQEGADGIKPVAPNLISGSDRSKEAAKAARKNCRALDENSGINITQQDVFDMDGLEGYTIVCNPPYGVRMERDKDLTSFYKSLGDFLKQRCKGSNAFIYFGDLEYVKALGLKPAWKRPLYNGGIRGQVAKIEIF
ncbi:MAG: class I SAM-dependent RNA methyltransferase, partial [Candidatus Latescibacteria bacterium]|nr:class I SAM-dependent RNA methyltransferase [Candidatus Latescibacterota bacterium]